MTQKYTAHLYTDWPDSIKEIFGRGVGWGGAIGCSHTNCQIRGYTFHKGQCYLHIIKDLIYSL